MIQNEAITDEGKEPKEDLKTTDEEMKSFLAPLQEILKTFYRKKGVGRFLSVKIPDSYDKWESMYVQHFIHDYYAEGKTCKEIADLMNCGLTEDDVKKFHQDSKQKPASETNRSEAEIEFLRRLYLFLDKEENKNIIFNF